MQSVKSKINLIFSLFLGIFLFVNLAGLNLSASAMVDGMNDCPIMQGMDSLCAMGLIEHVNSWFNMMSGILPNLLLVLAVAIAAYFVRTCPACDRQNFLYSPARQRWRNNLLQLFIPLKFALSRGIIQPKLYS